MEPKKDTEEVAVVMFNFSPDVFDPNIEQLEAIKAEVAGITADPANITKEELGVVVETRKKLKNARVSITKRGKSVREAAVQFQKDVIGYEKKLIGIIEPEEDRLEAIEEATKVYAIQEERRKTLPEFIEKLAGIKDSIEADEAFLLSLDPNQRDQYYTERLRTKLEADKAAMERKAEEEARVEEDKKAALLSTRREIMLQIGFITVSDGLFLSDEVVFRNYDIASFSESDFAKFTDIWRKQADEKKNADIKAAEEEATRKAQEQAAQDAAAAEAKRLADEAAAKKEAEEKVAKEEAERQERESAEAFQQFLNENSYNEATDCLVEDQDAEGNLTILYRTVAVYRHQ